MALTPLSVAAERLIGEWYPDLNVETIEGGQPHYPYIVGIE